MACRINVETCTRRNRAASACVIRSCSSTGGVMAAVVSIGSTSLRGLVRIGWPPLRDATRYVLPGVTGPAVACASRVVSTARRRDFSGNPNTNTSRCSTPRSLLGARHKSRECPMGAFCLVQRQIRPFQFVAVAARAIHEPIQCRLYTFVALSSEGCGLSLRACAC